MRATFCVRLSLVSVLPFFFYVKQAPPFISTYLANVFAEEDTHI